MSAPSTPLVDLLLAKLDRVHNNGRGWRACCPACGGRSQKLSVAVADNRVLVHCFGGCAADAVLAAVGLRWADLQPSRSWPDSPEERKRHRQALKEVGWASALETLALESKVVLLAGRDLSKWHLLSPEDDERLAAAVSRIDHAANLFTQAAHWRPQAVSA